MLIEGVKHLLNVISEEDRQKIESAILAKYQANQMNFEKDASMYKNSFGLPSIPEIEPIFDDMTEVMEEETGLKLKIANSYSRIYFNDSTLNSHVDRENLDLTLSIQIANTTGYIQPLLAESYGAKHNYETLLNDGDGLLVKGKDLFHWRPNIYSVGGGYLMCLFLHWEIVGGEIETQKHFLSSSECQEIIAEAEAIGFVESTVIQEKGTTTDKHYRNSATQFWKDNHLVTSRVKTYIPMLEPFRFEGWQLVRYQVGDEFKPHFDSGSGMIGRLFTVIIYLNDNFEGGETDFPKTGDVISPEQGKMVIWKNVNNDTVNDKSYHAGLPIISGVKYILVNWILTN